jgi:hypothetical protein
MQFDNRAPFPIVPDIKATKKLFDKGHFLPKSLPSKVRQV